MLLGLNVGIRILSPRSMGVSRESCDGAGTASSTTGASGHQVVLQHIRVVFWWPPQYQHVSSQARALHKQRHDQDLSPPQWRL